VSELIKAAKDLVNKRVDDKSHSVAVVVQARSGEVTTSMNSYHFTDDHPKTIKDQLPESYN
jgi:hypothetical protein